MNQYQQPHSPTYQHHQLFSKNNRLYQQLVQEDYLNDHIYQQNKQKAPHANHIKFNNVPSYPIKISKQPQYFHQHQDFSPKLPKTNNLFKGLEPSVGKISNHATQSLSSNYCITQNENQQNSTVNLYSLSRNHIEADLDLSSNNVTAKINEEKEEQEEQDSQKLTTRNDNIILQTSILNNNSINHEDSSQLQSENIKKYRSQQYSHMPYNFNQQDEEEEKMPKILTDKYIKNDMTKKFSTSHNSEHDQQSTFKTVLNQIHVVPYKINNQVKPYAFSVPIQNKQYQSIQNNTIASSVGHNENKKVGKANSLNLNNSKYSVHQQEVQTFTPNRPLYFSNHTHLHIQNQNRTSGHLTIHQSNQQMQKSRAYPRSQPKYNSNNERNTRSNSIQCKNKPNIIVRDPTHQHQHYKNPQVQRENLEQSHVTKIFKNNFIPEGVSPLETSVIYESQGIDICCNLTRQNEQVNKINFMARPKQHKQEVKLKGNDNKSPFFISSIDMTKVSTLQNGRGIYKINPIQMIREMNQSEGQKGIKLVGFPNRKDKL